MSSLAQVDEISIAESERLITLETTIEKGLRTFVEVGNALMEIRDNGLYRATFVTFEDYCRERWGIERRRAYQLMEAAQVVNNVNNCTQITPTNESQARPLTPLSSQQQAEVWPLVVETAPNGKITAAHVQYTVDNYLDTERQEFDYDSHLGAALNEEEEKPADFHYLRDNRRMVAGDIYTPQRMDACQTPAYALDPLLSYLPRNWIIWEPAAGEGNIVEALFDSGFKSVVSTDLIRQENFFEFEPDRWDCIVTNPPFSIHFEWLERCYKLGQPFALLLKVDILGTRTAQELFDQHGIEVIFVNPRINFKMPNKGWDSAAQFSTAWFTYGLNIGQQMTFARIKANGSSD